LSYRIIIHAGYPKSASTALQDALVNSRDLLYKQGVLYPESLVGEGSTKHEDIFRFVRLNKIDYALKLLKTELDSADDIHTVILSTESIINQLNNIGAEQWRELFKGLGALGSSLEILVVHRDADKFLKSYYKQTVINQSSKLVDYYGTSLVLGEFSDIPAIRYLLDLERVVKNLEDYSGVPVKVFDYSPNVVGDIISWASQARITIESENLSNVSLKPEEVEIIRQLNALSPEITQRNAWFRLLSYCSPLSNSTALTLASRAQDSDMISLDLTWLLSIQVGQNPELGVDDSKLLSLAQTAYQWLSKYKADHVTFNAPLNQDQVLMSLKLGCDHALENCVRKKLEKSLLVSSNISLGEALFVEKKLELAPFKSVAFSNWGDWERDPLKNRSWQWRLNWLSFLPYLLSYHRSSGNDDVLVFAHDAISSWLKCYIDTDTGYHFEFIWHDHATALRAEQLVLFYYYCTQYALEWVNQNKGFFKYLEKSLVVHAGFLLRDSFYSEHTNHGLEQARVLLLLGTVFDSAQASEWKKVSIHRISNELNFAFTSEGVHVENSPAYHIFVFKVFMGVIKDYPEEILGDLARQFGKFSLKALSFITHILRPDGTLPPIGDTEQLPTSDSYREMFGETREYQYFLYAISGGKRGRVPPILNRVYSESGYAVFRDQWPSRKDYHKAMHLIAKVGCSSRYHHQQDEGHISLYAGGEDWLIDSGLYNYVNQDPVRKYMRGRSGHNVPVVSHAAYDSEFEHRLSAWRVEDFNESDSGPYIDMNLKVMPPVVHDRNIKFDANKKIVDVEDRIVSEDGKERNVTLYWHFPKDKTLVVDNGVVLVTSTKGNLLQVEFSGARPSTLSIAKGEKDGKVFSCISYKANKVEPSQVLRLVFKNQKDLRVLTRFKLELADANKIAVTPPRQRDSINLDELVETASEDSWTQPSLVLGSSKGLLKLAKKHRELGIGHLTVILADSVACNELQGKLVQNYLTTWVSCDQVDHFDSGHRSFGVVMVTGGGLLKKQLTQILLEAIGALLKQAISVRELWVSDDLPESVLSFCMDVAKYERVKVVFVSGADISK
jgi:hypothetical protein